MGKIGFTSTIPVEILLASGKIPVDLNNFFVMHSQREELLQLAEREGMPRTVCAWIKGLYATLKEPVFSGYL
jgi:benzoyl-CoA reductase/2-hydroxyglutaryl-CoA dehydratase subunit BcrC/BadD/HgdB